MRHQRKTSFFLTPRDILDASHPPQRTANTRICQKKNLFLEHLYRTKTNHKKTNQILKWANERGYLKHGDEVLKH